jgi:hypothetical protein
VLWCTYRRNSLAHSVTFAECGVSLLQDLNSFTLAQRDLLVGTLHHLHPPPSLALLD